MNATHPALTLERSRRRLLPVRLSLSAVLLAAGLSLHGRDADLFTRMNASLNALPGPLLPTLWSLLSVAGLGLSVFIVLVALHRGREARSMRPISALLWSFPIGGGLTHLFKRLIEQPRPAAVLPPDALTVIGHPLLSGAMPSGHAVTALALAGLLLTRPRSPLQRALIIAGTLALLLARVAVGAHWPADLFAGAALGLLTATWAWQLAGHSALTRWLGTRPGQLVLALGQLVCGLAIARIETGYPAALPLQAVLAVLSIAAGLHRTASALGERSTPP
ncbi:MAG: hypothetical protein RL223_3503 [Pseudomonadota bacterium]